MEIKTSIVLPDQVTMKGRRPFRLDIKCPVCGKMMRLRDMNRGCSDLDGNSFTFECDECGTQVCAITVDKQE